MDYRIVQYWSKLKSKWTLLAILCIALLQLKYITYFDQFHKDRVFWSDARTYYGYLPGMFEKDNLSEDDPDKLHLVKAPNGKMVYKYTLGVALMQSPFFIVANNFIGEDDPYGPVHGLLIQLSALFFCVTGLLFVRKTLLLFYNEWISAIGITVLALGTNLFYYTVVESGMSHVYSFFVVSAFVYYTFLFVKEKSKSSIFLLFVLAGMIFLIRPINVLIAAFPLIYFVAENGFPPLRTLVVQQLKIVLLGLLAFVLIVFLQLFFWKWKGGAWWINTYENEQFFFNQPKILEGLFSYRKGFFVYTPVMVLFLVGIVLEWRKSFNRILFFYFVALSFFFFSWWSWWYGGGFGMRVFVDFYPFFILPVVAVVYRVVDGKQLLKQWTAISILGLFALLNLFQNEQYRRGIIHWDGMNKKAYWSLFLQRGITQQEADSLFTPTHFEKSIKGDDEYEFNPF